MKIPGIADDRHFNHLPTPHKRIPLWHFMELRYCSPTSPTELADIEIRQTPIEDERGQARTTIYCFATFALAVQSIKGSAMVADADLRGEDWDFRFYYLGCEHHWRKVALGDGSGNLYYCPDCGATEDWDPSG